jgi:hypothetical protein
LQQADELFAAPPDIQKIDILTNKLPQAALAEPNTKGLLLIFKAKDGQEQEVVQFLKKAQPLAMEEEQTTAWFAIRSPSYNEYGIFDVFPHDVARLKHMTGHIPRKLAKQSLTLLGSFPEMQLLTVTSENFN